MEEGFIARHKNREELAEEYKFDLALDAIEKASGLSRQIILSKKRPADIVNCRVVLSDWAFFQGLGASDAGRLLACNHATHLHRLTIMDFARQYPNSYRDLVELRERFWEELGGTIVAEEDKDNTLELNV